MLRQTPCETSNSRKGRDLIWVLFPRGRSLRQRQEGRRRAKTERLTERTEEIRLDSTLLNSRLESWTERERSWRLTARLHVSDKTGGNLVLPSRPQILICGENIWVLQPTFDSNTKREIWSHSGGSLAIMWMKEFYVTVLKRWMFFF